MVYSTLDIFTAVVVLKLVPKGVKLAVELRVFVHRAFHTPEYFSGGSDLVG